MCQFRGPTENGSAVLSFIFFLLILFAGFAVTMLKRAGNENRITYASYLHRQASYTVESSLGRLELLLKTSVANIVPTVDIDDIESVYIYDIDPADGINDEDGSLQFAIDYIKPFYELGPQEICHPNHEIVGVGCCFFPLDEGECIFPTENWTLVPGTEDSPIQVLFEFTNKPPNFERLPYAEAYFHYEYNIKLRSTPALGGESIVQDTLINGVSSGIFSISLDGAPLTHWVLMRVTNVNQNGFFANIFGTWNAGGEHTPPEVLTGRVHYNTQPHLVGDVIINGLLTYSSGEPTPNENDWPNITGDPDYSSDPPYINDAPLMVVPDPDMNNDGITDPGVPNFGNIPRLAIGDPDDPENNRVQPTNLDLRANLYDFIAPTGVSDLDAEGLGGVSSADLVDGIYIPVDPSNGNRPDGGIYVQGDVDIMKLDAPNWTEMGAAYGVDRGLIEVADSNVNGCSFQRYDITTVAGVNMRIYTTDKACSTEKTFAFTDAHPLVEVPGRLEGAIYTKGSVDKFGGAAADRPAIAKDFHFMLGVSAGLDIVNHIQYDDVAYVLTNEQGAPVHPDGSGILIEIDSFTGLPTNPCHIAATSRGQNCACGCTGVNNTDRHVMPLMDSQSQTLFGMMSESRNIMMKFTQSDPAAVPPVVMTYGENTIPDDVNMHANIFAAGRDGYSGDGFQCGFPFPPYKSGCGFGYEDKYGCQEMGLPSGCGNAGKYKGIFKHLGTLIEYITYDIGQVNITAPYSRVGFARGARWDTRNEILYIPGFPGANFAISRSKFIPFENLRFTKLVGGN